MLILPVVIVSLVQLNIALAAVCAPGQSLNQSSGTCVDCGIGHYNYIQDNSECLECPDNSNSTYRGAVMCECFIGYYRADSENVTVQCTAPPTAPSSVYAISMRFNSISIGWSPPTSNGGRTDISYRVTYTNGSYTSPVFSVGGDSLSYNITGLTPLTQYIIRVTSVNGVSDQDTDNDEQRTTIITVRTEDLPSHMPQSKDVDWHLVLGIVVPAVFFILFAIILYFLIYKLHKHRSSSSINIKQPIKCDNEANNKVVSPRPSVTSDTYYIDDTKVGRRVIGVDPLYEQINEDQQTPTATTTDYLFIMPLRDQNNTTIEETALQTPSAVAEIPAEHQYEETDRQVETNVTSTCNDSSSQANAHVYEAVTHCRKESTVSLV